ncbi:transglycosylase domain-containing protein [Clostridium sp. CCUG 7971]|uniref:transglycosylase domain-containing protein n=1 Tax=Clostridium sp. CCUG 7971 TaxID=2811414 RepID=UPI001ABAC2EE|nr:transglycosylase domain-containing protein [Clostridium sp. CCUG 7971]MBO3445806.1 transglycosylase domain-containing protein [Clostridium sp. CCUG 7971]
MSNDNNENKNKIRRKQVSSSNRTSKPTGKPSSSTRNTKPKPKSKSNKKNDKFKFFRVSGIVILVLLVLGAAGGTGLVFASLKNVQPVTKALLDEKTYQTTKIKYSNNELLSNAPSVNKKEPIPFDSIPQNIKDAVVAIEDERFYEHKGVDIKGLFRSVVKTLTGTKQGGSTIPMQVSKMLLTSKEQSLPRKIKDIYYAYEMSKTLSKNEILEAYLNNFFVGKGLAGVEAGARGYFDKKASELSLAESALLAGSTKNPSRYSAYMTSKLDGNESKEDVENKLLFFINTPDDALDDPTKADFDMVKKLHSWGLIPNEDTFKQLKSGTMVVRKAINNPKAKQRQEVVLKKMLEVGFISQSDYDEAVAEKIKIKLPKAPDKVASSVEDYIEYNVIDALVAQGNTKDEAYNMFYNGGLEIMTTIDPKMQGELEKQYDDTRNFPGSKPGDDGIIQPQSSMVILDYRNGQIKALVGGRHITGRKTLNRATTAQQPGSTIKPLSVYAPAIDSGLTQSTSLSDAKGGYKFNHKGWNPNTTTSGRGSMTLRKALAYSSNTIAIKTAEMLGDTYEEAVDVMMDYLKNFGISTLVDSKTADLDKSDRRFPALTLGGMTHGISPLEMAAAYGTLANGGVYVEPIVFTTITSYDGQVIVKNTPEEHKVVSPEVAYVVTDMLASVITEGIGKSASLGSMPVAGKTGTTNEALDAWFVGYTPYYVGATYIGDDAGRKDPNTGKFIKRRSVNGGSGTASRLWAKVMGPIHKNLEHEVKFKEPDNIYFTKINLIDGGKSSFGSSAAFIKGTYPTRSYTTQPTPNDKPKEEEEQTPTTPENSGGANPPEGGGGTTTPPAEGGGGNTNPTPPPAEGGGGTTTPPAEGGGGTTNPTPPPAEGGGGGATAPPAEPAQ